MIQILYFGTVRAKKEKYLTKYVQKESESDLIFPSMSNNRVLFSLRRKIHFA